jgi:hypothetical protein
VPTLLRDPGFSLTVSHQGIQIRGYSSPVLAGVEDYKALIGLSLLRISHFHARRGASMKDLNSDTTSVSKAKCFPLSQRNTKKHTNVGKPLELRGARVIYRVGQITHRAITTKKRDQVIVTIHASKLKTK